MDKPTVLQRFVKFCNSNVVLISGGALIVSIHWTWYMIQNTKLVSEEKRKDFPFIIAAKYLKNRFIGDVSLFQNTSTTSITDIKDKKPA